MVDKGVNWTEGNGEFTKKGFCAKHGKGEGLETRGEVDKKKKMK